MRAVAETERGEQVRHRRRAAAASRGLPARRRVGAHELERPRVGRAQAAQRRDGHREERQVRGDDRDREPAGPSATTMIGAIAMIGTVWRRHDVRHERALGSREWTNTMASASPSARRRRTPRSASRNVNTACVEEDPAERRPVALRRARRTPRRCPTRAAATGRSRSATAAAACARSSIRIPRPTPWSRHGSPPNPLGALPDDAARTTTGRAEPTSGDPDAPAPPRSDARTAPRPSPRRRRPSLPGDRLVGDVEGPVDDVEALGELVLGDHSGGFVWMSCSARTCRGVARGRTCRSPPSRPRCRCTA